MPRGAVLKVLQHKAWTQRMKAMGSQLEHGTHSSLRPSEGPLIRHQFLKENRTQIIDSLSDLTRDPTRFEQNLTCMF